MTTTLPLACPLGLAVAQLAVMLLVPPGADLEVAVDDSVFRRSGRKVHGADWQHDGSSPSAGKLSYDLAPPRTGRRGRPRTKGDRLGTAGDIAATAAWATVTVTAYGRQQVRHVAEVTCLWYGSWHTRTVRLILARDEHTASGHDLALVTTDPATSPGALVARYATRWAIEQAFADARNVLGACEARNRVRLAVERTVPFALLVHTLIIIWYARHGHDPADIDDRRASQPWYRTKTEPAFEDMLIKLRRTLIAARFSASRSAQPTDEQIRAVLAAWDAAVA